MREQAFLPAGQKDGIEFQPFGGVQGHDRDLVLRRSLVVVHDQGDVFQEALQVLEFLQRLHQFLEVFQPPGSLRRFVGLKHGGVAAFPQDRLRHLHRVGVLG